MSLASTRPSAAARPWPAPPLEFSLLFLSRARRPRPVRTSQPWLLLPLCMALGGVTLAQGDSSARGAVPGGGNGSGSVTETATAAPVLRPPPATVRVEQGARQTLELGDVLTLRVAGVVRIAIGNGAPVRATVVDDREIVLLGEAIGRTRMHVWTRSGRQVVYELEVVDRRAGRVFVDLKDILQQTPGLTARLVGDRVVLEGRYQNREVATKVKRLTESFPQILNLVPDQPQDVDPLQLERMVHIDLRVIEVKRRALEQLGIRWADAAAGPTFATNALINSNTPWRPPEQAGFPAVNTFNPVKSYLGLATQITSALRFLESRGEAWTLAEPRLSCRSGGEAKFLAGGEIPIPVAQGNGAVSVDYKQYGVRIEFKPLADALGNVDTGLMVEVSEPDARNSNAGFVALATNRTDTRVALKEGEPLVISGLLRQRTETGADGVPGLGRLPLLGGLFRSKALTNEQTELFVIATPRVITPESALNRDAVAKAAELARKASQRTEEALATPVLPEFKHEAQEETQKEAN